MISTQASCVVALSLFGYFDSGRDYRPAEASSAVAGMVT